MGGYNTDKSEPLAAVESFDLVSEEWSSLPSMRVPRFRLSCVTLDGKIFAMGGRDNVRNFLTVETFDTENKKWNTPDNHMIRARDEFCATVHEGMIYSFGGRGVQNIECCDPNSGGVWKDIGVMGEGKCRTGASCVTFTPFFDDLPHQF
jgi:N-acetylneuraminic acid mutarotase